MTSLGWPGSTFFLMSTTHSTASETARDPLDLYKLIIHESPEVCSACHARIRAPRTVETGRQVQSEKIAGKSRERNTLGTGDDELDALRRGASGTAAFDVEDIDAHGAKRTYFLRTFCGECGQPGGRARDREPSKQTMLESVPALIDRLADHDIPANVDVLRYVVGHLRSQPEYGGQETEIWSVATKMAVEKARPRDCVRATYGTDKDGART
ncbi:hypothetical protein OSG_eHP14_00045 [environmental Halophage eHP-14]|nr:hypothetical protein OSG_eHP14_00045 [environmental Halophage eHP-14]